MKNGEVNYMYLLWYFIETSAFFSIQFFIIPFSIIF